MAPTFIPFLCLISVTQVGKNSYMSPCSADFNQTTLAAAGLKMAEARGRVLHGHAPGQPLGRTRRRGKLHKTEV